MSATTAPPANLIALPDESFRDAIVAKLADALHADFPRKGVVFVDIFPLFREPPLLRMIMSSMGAAIRSLGAEVVVGIESRGLLVGALVADAVGLPFLPARKAGKLPGKVEKVPYSLEYGTDTMEMQRVESLAGSKAVVVDDLLATGGTLAAAVCLCSVCGLTPVAALVFVEIVSLHGAAKLSIPVHTVLRM